MSQLEVVPVRTARQRKRFIELPWNLYRDDPHWVPPLLADIRRYLHPRKGVFFEYGKAELFLAYRGGRPVGRISAQINERHEARYHDNKGFFGFFECEDDLEAAQALFGTAETWLAQQGKTAVEGPLSFTIYDEIGVLIDGFDSTPYVLNIHNRPYYPRLLEACGYGKAIDWYAFRIRSAEARERWPERFKRVRDRVVKRERMRLRTMDPARFDDEAKLVKRIFDEAWSDNYGHVPMSDAEFLRLIEGVKRMVIPELSFFAEVNGEAVAFAVSLYDVNLVLQHIDGRLFPFGFIKLLRQLKRTRRFRLALMGVLKAFQGRGYEAVFSTEVAERGLEFGFEECEMSNVVENNEPMLRSLNYLPNERYKTYRLYEKALTGSTAASAPISPSRNSL